MNYIGSKLSLIDFITSTIISTISMKEQCFNHSRMTMSDLFAGTGVVGAAFKKKGLNVISNDIQAYSYVLNKHYIENTHITLDRKKCKELINYLQSLKGEEGFIYKNYALGGTLGSDNERMYFTDENALKCDAIRSEIERLFKKELITSSEYYYLLACLLKAIDKVANTASVYGAFLKKFKKSALKPLELKHLEIIKGTGEYKVYNDDVNKIISKIKGDILYLDPPYNQRQYCANYHILETIALYDNPVISGKTGLRNYADQKSQFCSSRTVKEAFESLIKNADFKYIFLSYNNEGLMSLDTIKNIMEKYGEYTVFTQAYQRFKADKTENRNHKADSTIEYLHCLIKK